MSGWASTWPSFTMSPSSASSASTLTPFRSDVANTSCGYDRTGEFKGFEGSWYGVDGGFYCLWGRVCCYPRLTALQLFVWQRLRRRKAVGPPPTGKGSDRHQNSNNPGFHSMTSGTAGKSATQTRRALHRCLCVAPGYGASRLWYF